MPNPTPQSTVKKWIAHSEDFAKGQVFINAKAEQTLRSTKAASLLLVGVTRVEGEFEEGDIINVVGPEGDTVAIGRSGYSSDNARQNIGKHGIKPLIHYDYLYMEQ